VGREHLGKFARKKVNDSSPSGGRGADTPLVTRSFGRGGIGGGVLPVGEGILRGDNIGLGGRGGGISFPLFARGRGGGGGFISLGSLILGRGGGFISLGSLILGRGGGFISLPIRLYGRGGGVILSLAGC